MMAVIVRILLVESPVVCLVIIYIIYVQLQNMAYKKIALAFNAEYQSQGFILPKRMISGKSNKREFTMRDTSFFCGESGVGTTEISFNCQNRGIPLLTIYGSFWVKFTACSPRGYAFIRWRKKDFVTSINPSIEDKHKAFFRNLFQEIALFNCSFLRKGWIEVKPDRITFYSIGFIMNIERIKQAIQLLEKFVCRIESYQ